MLTADSLVDNGLRCYGRLETRPGRAAPLDEFNPLTRWLRRLRLKEWVGFTLLHPDWASSMIMQDAHYLASSEVYVAHRRDGTRHEHAANARGGSLRLPARFYGSDSQSTVPVIASTSPSPTTCRTVGTPSTSTSPRRRPIRRSPAR